MYFGLQVVPRLEASNVGMIRIKLGFGHLWAIGAKYAHMTSTMLILRKLQEDMIAIFKYLKNCQKTGQSCFRR